MILLYSIFLYTYTHLCLSNSTYFLWAEPLLSALSLSLSLTMILLSLVYFFIVTFTSCLGTLCSERIFIINSPNARLGLTEYVLGQTDVLI